MRQTCAHDTVSTDLSCFTTSVYSAIKVIYHLTVLWYWKLNIVDFLWNIYAFWHSAHIQNFNSESSMLDDILPETIQKNSRLSVTTQRRLPRQMIPIPLLRLDRPIVSEQWNTGEARKIWYQTLYAACNAANPPWRTNTFCVLAWPGLAKAFRISAYIYWPVLDMS